MLKAAEVADDLDGLTSTLGPDHPLVAWKRDVERGVYPPPDDEGWDEPASRAMLAVALDNLEDPYCLALALNIICWTPSPLDDDLLEAHRPGAVDQLTRLSAECYEPILGYWISGAALALTNQLAPAYAAEMQMLAWRLGRRLENASFGVVGFYVDQLLKAEGHSVPLAGYLASARRDLAQHLRLFDVAEFDLRLRIVELECASELALDAANDGRALGVVYHAETATQTAQEITSIATELEKADSSDDTGASDSDGTEAMWIRERAGALTRAVADSYLIANRPAKALETLELACRIHNYEGSPEELALIARVLQSANWTSA
jgi:hypothetical protein